MIAPFTVRRSAAATGVQNLNCHPLTHSIVCLLPHDCLSLLRISSASGGTRVRHPVSCSYITLARFALVNLEVDAQVPIATSAAKLTCALLCLRPAWTNQ